MGELENAGRRGFIRNAAGVTAALGLAVLAKEGIELVGKAEPEIDIGLVPPKGTEQYAKWERAARIEHIILGLQMLYLRSFQKNENDLRNIIEKEFPAEFHGALKQRLNISDGLREFEKAAASRSVDWITKFQKEHPEADIDSLKQAMQSEIASLAEERMDISQKLKGNGVVKGGLKESYPKQML